VLFWMMGVGEKVCLFARITRHHISNRGWGAENKSTDESKKWTMGRSASAKVREGFGFRRSMSTQGA